MKQKLFSLLALFLFVSIGLTTDTKADNSAYPCPVRITRRIHLPIWNLWISSNFVLQING